MAMNEEDTGRIRLRVYAFVVLILFGALFTRLWYLQGIESEGFREAAEAQVLREVFEEAPRGRILDRSGRVIVDNKVVDVVTIDKAALDGMSDEAQMEMFHSLAVAISRSGRPTKLDSIVDEMNSVQYDSFDVVPVAVDVDPSLLVFIGERPTAFPGVDVETRTVRSYPFGSLAAHVLGYVGPVTLGELQASNERIDEAAAGSKAYQLSDEIGKTGIERIFEDVLRGVPGVRYIEVDSVGRVVRERTEFSRAPVPGHDLFLTIDIDLQAMAEAELESSLAARRGRTDDFGNVFVSPAGSVVATDPVTGELLAMASFPTYSPSDFVNGISFAQWEQLNSPDNYKPIWNRAIQENYAPGSTFKPIPAFAALEAGYLDPDSPIVEARDGRIEDRGVYTLPQCRTDFEASDTCLFRSPREGLPPETFSLVQALSASSDVFFYKLAAEGFYPEPVRGPEGDEAMQEMARRFGLGETTAVQLPFETAGAVPDRDYFDLKASQGVFVRDGSQWFPGDTVLLSIGQGEMLLTPIQLANVYATIANDGELLQVSTASKIVSHDGELITEFGPRVLRDLELDPAHLAEVELGLLGVPKRTSVDGTAWRAFEGFDLVAWPVAGKTGTAEVDGKADTSLFVGYGPVLPGRDPEIAVAVVLEESGFGSAVAAPVARDLLEAWATDSIPTARTTDEVEQGRIEVAIEVAIENDDAADDASSSDSAEAVG
ncbi:MAG: penicillin-binding protein 2 [Candidatus Aldehydirespiratoraceae bacterium]|jgi:penicillin-binding protein 2